MEIRGGKKGFHPHFLEAFITTVVIGTIIIIASHLHPLAIHSFIPAASWPTSAGLMLPTSLGLHRGPFAAFNWGQSANFLLEHRLASLAILKRARVERRLVHKCDKTPSIPRCELLSLFLGHPTLEKYTFHRNLHMQLAFSIDACGEWP